MKTWSQEEDYIIIDGVKLHGHQWRIIVRKLPGRSVSSTRNRFNRIEQGRMMRETGTRGRNMCHFCWQPKKGHICTAAPASGPHVVTQALVVRPAPLPFVVAQQGAVPHVAGPSDANPAPWARPNVQKSSSLLSVLGAEDLSAIFGEWAKADAADNAGGIGLCSAASAYAAEVSASAALPPPLLGCLRSLALAQCTTLGDETLAALAAHAPALTALNLSGCLRLSDDAVGLMLSRLPRLTSVDLSYLCVSDAGGVRALCGLRALTSVNLEGCPLCTEVAKPKPKPNPNPDPDPNPNPNQVGLAQLTRALPALELANFSGW